MNDPIDLAAEARATIAAMRHKPAPRRTTKTPEAKVSAKSDAYLKKIGAICIRTNAGSWQDEAGRYIQGAKAGTSDKTCCLPNGVFCAVEDKSATGQQTEAQRRYQQRVEALGGLYILTRNGGPDIRAALVARFGEATVRAWES